jgi:hypothetical protein
MRKSQVDRLGFFVSTVLIELAQNQRWRSKNQETQWIGFFFDNDVRDSPKEIHASST